jgi:hypothetical protein
MIKQEECAVPFVSSSLQGRTSSKNKKKKAGSQQASNIFQIMYYSRFVSFLLICIIIVLPGEFPD